MNRASTTFRAVLCPIALAVGLASAQTPSGKTAAATASAPAPVAYVYIGTAKGVNLYNAAANGRLTLVPGSPFQTIGKAMGSNGKYFFNLGTYWVHVYPIKSNGAIGTQVSQINTQNYTGANCGSTGGAILDHTGQNLYVLLQGGPNSCIVYQTFGIAKASGALTFTGAAVLDDPGTSSGSVPTITANSKFAYATTYSAENPTWLSAFSREANGTLNLIGITETDPQPPQDGYDYFTFAAAADPTNHLAVTLMPVSSPPFYHTGPVQIGSYTVDSGGNVTSTNTASNMPKPAVGAQVLNMSPSGKLLAAAGGNPVSIIIGPPGLQVFHFNGANPITPFGKVLTTAPVDQIHWDKSNHLYALSSSTGQLFVYTITPTSIAQAPGSPYKIAKADALVVVPK
jgi:hypothetical protein